MYRQYENPKVIEAQLNAVRAKWAERKKLGYDLEEEYDLYMEIADLTDRLRFAYADEYEEEY